MCESMTLIEIKLRYFGPAHMSQCNSIRPISEHGPINHGKYFKLSFDALTCLIIIITT